jgi:hypothetical protein
MPRRPRPASRAPPKSVRDLTEDFLEQSHVRSKRKSKVESESEGSLESDSDENEIMSNMDEIKQDAESYENEGEIIEDEEDADAPRVARWVDEDELGILSGSGNESDSEDEERKLEPKMKLVC